MLKKIFISAVLILAVLSFVVSLLKEITMPRKLLLYLTVWP